MRKLMLFRFGGREVHMPRLIGAFILFAALLFFIQASAQMFNVWDNVKEVNSCLASSLSFTEGCQKIASDALGVYVSSDQSGLSVRQFWSVVLSPIATILFWLAVLFFGWMVYKTGDLVLPIEESTRVLPAEHQKYKKHG